MKYKFIGCMFGLTLILGVDSYAFDFGGIQEALRAQIEAARASNGLPPSNYQPAQQQATIQASTLPIMTQEELGVKVNALGHAKGFVIFAQKKEGFAINQRNYMDPEAKIIKYGFDGTTGMVTYLAEVVPGQYIIKTMQTQNQAEPISIASARHIGGTWEVSTVTGKRLTGQEIVMGSRGFVLNRENGAIIYDAVTGMKTASLPDGYKIADFQNGDALQTRYVLLEALKSDDQNENVIGSFKALGSHFGLSKKEDYVLMNIDTDKLIRFNISSESKNQSECIQKGKQINAFVGKCEKSVSFESLYDKFGMPNVGHYYWRVMWVNTPSGKTIAVTIEDGVKRLMATDLLSGKKVLLKERLMGINQFKMRQEADGKIFVDVQLGFSDETVEDIEKQLETLPVIEA